MALQAVVMLSRAAAARAPMLARVHGVLPYWGRGIVLCVSIHMPVMRMQ